MKPGTLEELEDLIHTLRANGVAVYEQDGIQLRLYPAPPEVPEPRVLSDKEKKAEREGLMFQHERDEILKHGAPV